VAVAGVAGEVVRLVAGDHPGTAEQGPGRAAVLEASVLEPGVYDESPNREKT
jgi:hypothetical protein